MLLNSKLSSFLTMIILGNWISTKSFKLGFLWFQSSLISLKPGFEHVIVKLENWILIDFIVSIILGFIWPVMILIFLNLNSSWKFEITSLIDSEYYFSGGWIMKKSLLPRIKKVLNEVPFSRLNSSSNLSLFWSRNLMPVSYTHLTLPTNREV